MTTEPRPQAPAIAFDLALDLGTIQQSERCRLVVTLGDYRGRLYLHVRQERCVGDAVPTVWQPGRQEIVVPMEEATTFSALIASAIQEQGRHTLQRHRDEALE